MFGDANSTDLSDLDLYDGNLADNGSFDFSSYDSGTNTTSGTPSESIFQFTGNNSPASAISDVDALAFLNSTESSPPYNDAISTVESSTPYPTIQVNRRSDKLSIEQINQELVKMHKELSKLQNTQLSGGNIKNEYERVRRLTKKIEEYQIRLDLLQGKKRKLIAPSERPLAKKAKSSLSSEISDVQTFSDSDNQYLLSFQMQSPKKIRNEAKKDDREVAQLQATNQTLANSCKQLTQLVAELSKENARLRQENESLRAGSVNNFGMHAFSLAQSTYQGNNGAGLQMGSYQESYGQTEDPFKPWNQLN